jgi:ubiquinone/menaquinone biosynthesis C-methylase UbiE
MKQSGRSILRSILPPVVVDVARAFRRRRRPAVVPPKGHPDPGHQELEVYWDEEFANDLDQWGRGNVWDEILLLMAARRGRVLDVACGTGVNIAALSQRKGPDVHGCDISDLLIRRAVARGVPAERLTVCDATKMPYPDHSFDYGYSIGSLEHFDIASLEACVRECRRVIRGPVFHTVPVSRTDKDEGWIRRQQSFHNNGVAWWLARFAVAYPVVEVLNSRWKDDISIGKWFVCFDKE